MYTYRHCNHLLVDVYKFLSRALNNNDTNDNNDNNNCYFYHHHNIITIIIIIIISMNININE